MSLLTATATPPAFLGFASEPHPSIPGWRVCPREQVAYQEDLTPSEPYGEAYFAKYEGYAATERGRALDRIRVELAQRARARRVLDIGIGSGSFLRACFAADIEGWGYDVCPRAVSALQEEGSWLDPYQADLGAVGIEAVSLWGVFEHLADPDALLRRLPEGCALLLAIPYYPSQRWEDLASWRHFRPGEHLTCWTAAGIMSYLSQHVYDIEWIGRPEEEQGRQHILSILARRAG